MGYVLPSSQEQEQDILFGVINRFIGYFTRQVMPATVNNTNCEYPFVAMDTRQAYQQICVARDFFLTEGREPAGLRFIDIGCGIGNILLLAEMVGFQVAGIEKDTASLPVAQELLGRETVQNRDIWTYDDIAVFDVVYYFRPFSQGDMQRSFERRIEQEMRPGAVLIANRKMDESIASNPEFSRLHDHFPIWLKKDSQAVE